MKAAIEQARRLWREWRISRQPPAIDLMVEIQQAWYR